jgi:hypothetical protein
VLGVATGAEAVTTDESPAPQEAPTEIPASESTTAPTLTPKATIDEANPVTEAA